MQHAKRNEENFLKVSNM